MDMSYIKIVYSQRLASSYVSRSMSSEFFRTLSVIKQPIGKDWSLTILPFTFTFLYTIIHFFPLFSTYMLLSLLEIIPQYHHLSTLYDRYLGIFISIFIPYTLLYNLLIPLIFYLVYECRWCRKGLGSKNSWKMSFCVRDIAFPLHLKWMLRHWPPTS